MAAVRRGQQPGPQLGQGLPMPPGDGGLADELGKLLPASKSRSDGAQVFEREGGYASRMDNPNILLQFTFLVLLGAGTAVLALLIELAILLFGSVRHSVTFYFESAALSYLVWIFWGMAIAMAATGIPKRIDDNAVGSGLPQMKSILSGFVINRYMSLRTLVSKALGLGLCCAESPDSPAAW